MTELAGEALRHAAGRLRAEFDGAFARETIEQFVRASYTQFATGDVVLAERFARQRLHALAEVEEYRQDSRPIVLFLCVHNAGRSQMALGFCRQFAGDGAVAWSGGSKPAGQVQPAVVAAMAEVGIDISQEFPKPWTAEVVHAADVVITMGCGDACPVFPGRRSRDWAVPDPVGLPVAAVRPIRDEIERRVRDLLAELGVR